MSCIVRVEPPFRQLAAMRLLAGYRAGSGFIPNGSQCPDPRTPFTLRIPPVS